MNDKIKTGFVGLIGLLIYFSILRMTWNIPYYFSTIVAPVATGLYLGFSRNYGKWTIPAFLIIGGTFILIGSLLFGMVFATEAAPLPEQISSLEEPSSNIVAAKPVDLASWQIWIDVLFGILIRSINLMPSVIVALFVRKLRKARKIS